MRAVVYHHPKKVSVDNVPDPKIEAPTDLILKVTSPIGQLFDKGVRLKP